jgi:hypothetical protein
MSVSGADPRTNRELVETIGELAAELGEEQPDTSRLGKASLVKLLEDLESRAASSGAAPPPEEGSVKDAESASAADVATEPDAATVPRAKERATAKAAAQIKAVRPPLPPIDGAGIPTQGGPPPPPRAALPKVKHEFQIAPRTSIACTHAGVLGPGKGVPQGAFSDDAAMDRRQLETHVRAGRIIGPGADRLLAELSKREA